LGLILPHAIPVSMDVVALYPKVPWEEGFLGSNIFKFTEGGSSYWDRAAPIYANILMGENKMM